MVGCNNVMADALSRALGAAMSLVPLPFVGVLPRSEIVIALSMCEESWRLSASPSIKIQQEDNGTLK